LVGQERLAIDATEHVPLRVQVFARGAAKPAAEVAFTQISFARPDPEQFRFNPPPDAKVSEGKEPVGGQSTPPRRYAELPDSAEPTVVGTGWTSVLVARLPAQAPTGDRRYGGAGEAGVDGLLARLPRVSGDWGSGRLLSGRLFSVLVTDDGRVLLGAVAPDRLYQAAADPAARLGK
jgi:hypothetical protein